MSQSQLVAEYAGGGQRELLEPLQEMYDPSTIRYLEQLGVSDGWRCLEVGGGAGSIAAWLARRVAPSGSVVATDMVTTLLQELPADNLEVRQHDITADPLEEAAFDLVHARLLLEHLVSRQAVLEKLVRALRPDGWLLVEDMDWTTCRSISGVGADLQDLTVSSMQKLFALGGYHATFGAELPKALHDLGLVEVDNEARTRIIVGGTERAARFFVGNMKKLAAPFRAFRLMTDEQIEQAIAVAGSPEYVVVPALLVAAWGRRSSDG